jgi:hypothetical protein
LFVDQLSIPQDRNPVSRAFNLIRQILS